MLHIAKTVKIDELEEAERKKYRYVCMAFALDGIACTDWGEHGSCEVWTPKEKD